MWIYLHIQEDFQFGHTVYNASEFFLKMLSQDCFFLIFNQVCVQDE